MINPEYIDTYPLEHTTGYGHHFLQEQLYIETTNIRNNGLGIIAELNIYRPENTPIKSNVNLNLLNSDQRNRLALDLAKNYQDEFLSWGEIIEHVCRVAIKSFRQGEPIQKLWTNQDTKPVEYLAKPLIIKDAPNVLFGEHSSGKTTLAILLVTICELGNELKNTYGLTVPGHNEILFLDYENSADRTLWKLKAIKEGLGLPDIGLRYKSCHSPLSVDVDAVHDEIKNSKISLLVIDSLGLAAGGELKESITATSFYSSLRSLNTTSLILAHTSKGLDRKKTIFGSSYFENLARNIWEVQKIDLSEYTIRVALHHYKYNLTGKHTPLGFEFNYDCDQIHVATCEPSDEPEFREKMSIGARGLYELKNGDYSSSELAEILGESLNSVDHAMKRQEKNNKVVKVENKWRLI